MKKITVEFSEAELIILLDGLVTKKLSLSRLEAKYRVAPLESIRDELIEYLEGVLTLHHKKGKN
jgi:hypothetical protein